MNAAELEKIIDAGWETRDTVSPQTKGDLRDAVGAALDGLDSGALRVAEKAGGAWNVNQWPKKAVLPSFRRNHPAPGLVAVARTLEATSRHATHIQP